MLKVKEIPETNIMELTVDGMVTEEDFSVVTAILENKIGKHGKLRLLEDIRSFSGMPISLWWKDLKFSLGHMNDFERAAIVSDRGWARVMGKVMKPFAAGEIRCFERKELRKARSWLNGAKTTEVGA